MRPSAPVNRRGSHPIVMLLHHQQRHTWIPPLRLLILSQTSLQSDQRLPHVQQIDREISKGQLPHCQMMAFTRPGSTMWSND